MDVIAHDIDLLIQQGFAWRLEYSASAPASPGFHYVGLTVGTEQVLVLDRAFATDAADMTFRFYRNTGFTGGADIVLKNRNDNYWADATRAPFAVARGGVTATPVAADLMASLSISGTKKISGVGVNGVTIVLAPGRSYVLQIANADAGVKTAEFTGLFARYGIKCRE